MDCYNRTVLTSKEGVAKACTGSEPPEGCVSTAFKPLEQPFLAAPSTPF